MTKISCCKCDELRELLSAKLLLVLCKKKFLHECLTKIVSKNSLSLLAAGFPLQQKFFKEFVRRETIARLASVKAEPSTQ